MEFKLQPTEPSAQIYLADNGLGYRRLADKEGIKSWLAFYSQEGVSFRPICTCKRFQNCMRKLKEYAKENGL